MNIKYLFDVTGTSLRIINRFGKLIYANTHSLGKYMKFNDDPFGNSDHTLVDKTFLNAESIRTGIDNNIFQ